MDTQVDFSWCTNPDDTKRAMDEVPELTKGDWVLALQHALDMMQESHTRDEERAWHKLSKQLWQEVDKDFDQSEEEDSAAEEKLKDMNAQSAIIGEMAGGSIHTSWM